MALTTLFNGTVKYNSDPLSQITDQEIWEDLGNCQLREGCPREGRGPGLLSCGRWIKLEYGAKTTFLFGACTFEEKPDIDCTVIIVAHRIPTVMDCTMVLGISDGKLVEYDEPMKLMKQECSLFGQLVKEYWSHLHSAELHLS
ncbi:hypothetical protein Pint_17627 [Pistacia integerrima]|uniref:Uncharacterized protein n=1 Tax=Pistacia integerrima TaxID=434235 RepID=A0ACC0YXK3_9ROSI|nr:hypothetical protein Pint_17627 [Pistacia integerrima]